jgi:hypothetical protein
MADRLERRPATGVGQLAVPLHVAISGVAAIKPIFQGTVSTGRQTHDLSAGVDLDRTGIYVTVADRTYVIDLAELLQEVGDAHQRGLAQPRAD